MGILAFIIAFICFAFLWSTNHVLLKWLVLAAGSAAFYLRAVVESILRRKDNYEHRVLMFWSHAAVVSFWVSIALTVFGLYKIAQQ